MHNQLYEYFDNILFPSQCGFRKGYSAQHSLLVMIEESNIVKKATLPVMLMALPHILAQRTPKW